MSKISIIVPVYNAENSICRCIDSILKLSYSDYEVILVDDGSTDNSGLLCDKYAERNDSIRVIHKSNGGIASARNAGLSVANGKWIMFCDSDDCWDSKIMSAFFQEMFSLKDVDKGTLIGFNFAEVWPDGSMNPFSYTGTDITIEPVYFMSSKESHKTIGWSVWNKVYQKEIIDTYRIQVLERDALSHEDDWAEDFSFNLQYFMHINRIIVLDWTPYLLSKHGSREDQNENSLINRIDHMMDFFQVAYRSPYVMDNAIVRDSFWQLAVWHLRRYFYLDAQKSGDRKLRDMILQSRNYALLSDWINEALTNWRQYGKRWEEPYRSDYKYLLVFLKNGNYLRFQLCNYYHWIIKEKIANRTKN